MATSRFDAFWSGQNIRKTKYPQTKISTFRKSEGKYVCTSIAIGGHHRLSFHYMYITPYVLLSHTTLSSHSIYHHFIPYVDLRHRTPSYYTMRGHITPYTIIWHQTTLWDTIYTHTTYHHSTPYTILYSCTPSYYTIHHHITIYAITFHHMP